MFFFLCNICSDHCVSDRKVFSIIHLLRILFFYSIKVPHWCVNLNIKLVCMLVDVIVNCVEVEAPIEEKKEKDDYSYPDYTDYYPEEGSVVVLFYIPSFYII